MSAHDPFKREICGVPVELFKTPPTPEELGIEVGRWAADRQAEFVACLAQTLHDCCGYRLASQIAAIAADLNRYETANLDGKGSQLIIDLGAALAPMRDAAE